MTPRADTASLQAAIDAFESRYRRYLSDIADAKLRNSNVRRASTFVSQRRPFADDPIHAQARDDLQTLANAVTDALGSRHDGGPALAEITSLVLGEKQSDLVEYWPLVALEGLAKPWLASLSGPDLQAIYNAYRKANPCWQCLPNQRAVRQEFERLLKG